ncbi:hypothetical protein LguiA_034027 [Lonicera macranthoides]
MAVSAFTPLFKVTPTESISTSISPSISKFTSLRSKLTPKKTTTIPKVSSLTPISASFDPFVLQIAETLEDSLPTSPSPSPNPLQKLRDASSESLVSTRWPTRKDEPYRFTDTSFIKQSQILPVQLPKQYPSRVFEETHLPRISIVDGFVADLQLEGLPDGVFVGRLSGLDNEEIARKVYDEMSVREKDLFWSLNGVGAPDLVVVYVPAGICVESPLYLRYFSMEVSVKGDNKLPVSNPRVFVMVEKGGEIGVIEEFVGGDGDDSCYWANSVMEVVIGEGAKVSHSYIQNQSMSAVHIKWTSVKQESTSTYQLIEVSTGGKLSRHNVHVQQDGPDTVTELSTFHLSGCDQTQDLHSRLVLDHPRGFSRQLHKCIVSHSSGQAVFDGNVKVNRKAQQTDAGQLTRSLLLERSATINVKPNLQIEADDVKCSHGAAISDLEEDQIFYFQARGVDLQSARKALIFSFGAEVIGRFPNAFIKKKVESDIKRLMDPTLSSQ